jgi:hypothetical protein
MADQVEPARKPTTALAEPGVTPAALPASDMPPLQRVAAMLNAGPAATALRSTGATLARPVRGAPVQRKLLQNGAAVSRPYFATKFNRISPLVDGYLAAPETYVMRNDCALTDKTIHVIRADRKYLLGETHGSGEWEKRTANWTVDTMREGFNSLTEGGGGGGGGGLAPVRGSQPLDNTLNVTLAATLSAQSLLNQRLPVGNEDPNALLEDTTGGKAHSKLLCGTLKKIMSDYGPKFKDYWEGGTRDSMATEKARSTWDFAKLLVETWAPKVAALHNAIANLTRDFSGPAKATATQTISANRGVLEEIVDGILLLHAMGADAQVAHDNTATIKAFSTAQAGNLPAAVRAASPLREAAMIRNVAGARAPLFVQIGEEHLANVANGVGGTAVAVSKDDDFADVTRKP